MNDTNEDNITEESIPEEDSIEFQSEDVQNNEDLPEDEIQHDDMDQVIKKLKKQLAEEKKQSQEYLVGWQKERADFANFKTQEQNNQSQRTASAKTNLISDFFPVLDSFDMAFSNKDVWEKVDSNWRTGIEYIHSQFMNTLHEYGIELIDKVGEEFDPSIHDPIETVTVEKKGDDNRVIEVIQKGYKAKNVILRPAKVKVGAYEN